MGSLAVTIVLLFVWFAMGFVGATVWRGKGGDIGAAALLIVLFGLFGLLYVLVADYRQCPYCKERMRTMATVCPRCHRESQPPRSAGLPGTVRTSALGERVIGSTLGLPTGWANAEVEVSADRNWWRNIGDLSWRRSPYVDRYRNAWDGTSWLPGKRPESECWQGPDPSEPVS